MLARTIQNTVRCIPWTTRRLFSAVTSVSPQRDTVKPIDSRKTYLVDSYTNIIRNNSIVLVLHYGGLLRAESSSFRQRIKKAGGQLVVTRSKLFKVALRGLEHSDPASKEAHELYSRKKTEFGEFFNGPSAIITIPDMNPAVVKSIVDILDRSGDRLILLGARIDGKIQNRQQVDTFKALPSLDELRANLAGVLSLLGGGSLVQTLEAGSKLLYLTMESRQKQMEEEENK